MNKAKITTDEAFEVLREVLVGQIAMHGGENETTYALAILETGVARASVEKFMEANCKQIEYQIQTDSDPKKRDGFQADGMTLFAITGDWYGYHLDHLPSGKRAGPDTFDVEKLIRVARDLEARFADELLTADGAVPPSKELRDAYNSIMHSK